MEPDERKYEAAVKGIFSSVREDAPAAPPYLKTRVMARLEVRRRAGQKLLLWKWIACASTLALSLLILVPGFRHGSAAFEAGKGSPFALRVEVTELPEAAVAAVEVEVPEGLHFYSARHPEISDQKILRIAFNSDRKMGIPFILKSDREGAARVKVRFWDTKNSLLAEREIEVKIMGGGEARKEWL
jgi:hypothetical protein